jgi:hypothetical protein
MRKLIFINMFVLLSVVLAACGSSATPVESTSTKQVNIKVESDPNPVTIGDMELILTITDVSGNPIEGATVDVSVDHTDMTGMSMSGLATNQGGGKYSIKANFEMSGNWKMTIYVRKGELDYKEDIEFPVQ